ncbi:DUF819 family protein [Fulvivirga sp. 29W222]|uniref:DUF819 family protein n=1 Tax=Fulvivirga marina TaxID=2494733 RepID=A0A937G391_9BACT|nr:DUF819 family protein [Fulvivirga marina]MBL6449228.1 DUF819 family protein [Fulvivirga marina]
MEDENFEPLFTNDAVIFGILMTILAIVFKTAASQSPGWKKFYKVIPTILLCYFLPSLLNTFGLVDAEESRLYFVASRYLLPACLVLLTLSVDLKEIIRLGPKALVMFLTATVGVVIGGPLAILMVSAIEPDFVGGIGPDAVWRGMTTIAGSWIGGGANQAAMYELFQPSDSLFSVSITVDVIVAELWMTALLLGIGRADDIDNFLKADSSAITTLKNKMEAYSLSIAKIPSVADLMIILAIGFGATGFSHFIADIVAPYIAEHAPYLKNFSLDAEFFWIVVISTTIGVIFSFTKLRELEGAGASKIGTVFIFILVATIGMKMDVLAILENPGFFLVGLIWMIIHVLLLIIVAKAIKAPYFFLAVGSKANIGGAASAPVLAAAFHPALAPVGVLLAVLGYALGTYGAWLCGILMQIVSK